MNPSSTVIVAIWALYVFAVHTFAGQRRVATPIVDSTAPAFARGTIEVVWHAYSWNLLVSAVVIGWHALRPQPALVALVTVQLAGIGLLFMFLGPKRVGSGFGLPQWILVGPLVLALVTTPRQCTALLILALAGLHVLWALGLTWPAPSARSFSAYVVGLPDGTRPPGRLATVVVALVLAGFAAVVWLSVPWARWVVVGVLGARGLFGFVERRMRPGIAGTPYAPLSRFFYSPLCLFIAALAWSSR